MVRLRESARQSGYCGNLVASCILTVIGLLALCLIAGQSLQGQSQNAADSATLQGSVLDSHGHPVAAATVYLKDASGTQTLVARTDSEGTYRFSALREGVYTLRAKMAGFVEASFGPCVVGAIDVKEIDLILQSATVATPQSSSGTSGAEKPQFFDEPEFTVAGVTEAMNPGGHGSDTILRTTEALAKETASLSVPAVNEKSNRSRTASASSSSSSRAEESLRKAVEHEPWNFEAYRRLGQLLVEGGKAGEALPYLEQAFHLNPGDYENTYELALAYDDAGQYEHARTQIRALLAMQDKAGQERARQDFPSQNKGRQEQAELDHLLGDVEEKLGDPLEAVREYQRAAELDPSEPNLFDWGTDLLMHRAFEPAIEVFTKGNRSFPRSARMLAGLGVAWYARGSYDQAAQRLCEASDLNPDDPEPYLFMGKMQSVEATRSECLGERLGRFAGLQPENALANYYFALSLWHRREGSENAEKLAQVESLLDKTIHLDPKFDAGYLQLGILYSERGDSAKGIAAYQKAIEANPELEEAHYRLAQAYSRAGEKVKAQTELQLYDRLSKKTALEADRERREIQQFVYTLRGAPSVSQSK
jgi:tetratricopeptide (TPR) repeat protein